jgi:pimeloyl-ACP methyl ester carboxylesterase
MGIGYDATLWTLAQVPALSQRFQVVIFDNRDVGRSSKAVAPYTIADMADDVAALMDALAIERAHLLGLSMGGMIAQEFALRHADRLQRLVLSGWRGARASGFRSDPDVELGEGQRQERRGVRLPAVHLALLHCLPAQQRSGAADHQYVDEQP